MPTRMQLNKQKSGVNNKPENQTKENGKESLNSSIKLNNDKLTEQSLKELQTKLHDTNLQLNNANTENTVLRDKLILLEQIKEEQRVKIEKLNLDCIEKDLEINMNLSRMEVSLLECGVRGEGDRSMERSSDTDDVEMKIQSISENLEKMEMSLTLEISNLKQRIQNIESNSYTSETLVLKTHQEAMTRANKSQGEENRESKETRHEMEEKQNEQKETNEGIIGRNEDRKENIETRKLQTIKNKNSDKQIIKTVTNKRIIGLSEEKIAYTRDKKKWIFTDRYKTNFREVEMNEFLKKKFNNMNIAIQLLEKVDFETGEKYNAFKIGFPADTEDTEIFNPECWPTNICVQFFRDRGNHKQKRKIGRGQSGQKHNRRNNEWRHSYYYYKR